MIVRGAMTVPPFGNSSPSAEKSAARPLASASPSSRPITDATIPTTPASSMTARRTCFLDPPIVRSVANSRVRCAIVIESVFAITKLPTKRAIPPKASRNFCRIPSELWTSSIEDAVCAAAVLTFAVAGSSGRISATSCSCETPGFAATWTSSN